MNTAVFPFHDFTLFLQWPGYRQWSRQIPAENLRSPSGPVAVVKLAKNVAKCVQRFMPGRVTLHLMFLLSSSDMTFQGSQITPMEEGSGDRMAHWRWT